MYQTIIIGAGFAGLSAGMTLLENGIKDFLIVEARDRVGGRTKPGQLADLDIDLGGMWLSPSQTRLKHYADKYAVETYPTYLDGNGVIELQGKVVHGERENIDALFSLLEGVDYLNSRRKLDKLSKHLDCENPWDHPKAKELDTITVEQWLNKNIRSKKLKSLYRQICYAVFCAEADEISLLFYLHYLKSGDGFDKIISADSGGAQNYLFYGGAHQIAARMADTLADKIKLETPIHSIRWENEAATISGPSGEISAQRLILAIPPTLVPSIAFEPALPPEKSALYKRLTMGSAIKFWVAYEKPFWREQGFNGLILSDESPATPIMDVTPPNQTMGILAGFFDGDHAIENAHLSSEERKNIVIDTLAKFYGEEAREVSDYQDIDWSAEPWSEGCYGAYAPPGTYSRFGKHLRQQTGPMHWAGTETSDRWTGYIDGAIRSGERAANEVVATL